MALALQFDMELAVSLANRPQDDSGMQRKLWLAIARHLIQSATPDDPDVPPVRASTLLAAIRVSVEQQRQPLISLTFFLFNKVSIR